MSRNNQAVKIDSSIIPEPSDALKSFEDHGGHITLFSPFGHDPLESHSNLYQERESKFIDQYPEFGLFFYSVVNGDYSMFRQGLLCFIVISKELEAQI